MINDMPPPTPPLCEVINGVVEGGRSLAEKSVIAVIFIRQSLYRPNAATVMLVDEAAVIIVEINGTGEGHPHQQRRRAIALYAAGESMLDIRSLYRRDFEDWMEVRRTGKNSQGRPVAGAKVVKIPMSFDAKESQVPFIDLGATPDSLYRDTIGGWYGVGEGKGDPFEGRRGKDPNARPPMASTAGCPYATVSPRKGMPLLEIQDMNSCYRTYMDVTYEDNVQAIKDSIRGKSLRISPTGTNEDTFLTGVWDTIRGFDEWKGLHIVSHITFPSVWASVAFLLVCLYFTIFYDIPHYMRSKIQPFKWPTVRDLIVSSIPQMLVYIVLNGLLRYYYEVFVDLPAEAPSLLQFSKELLGCLIVGDFCIYWYHRWMHAVPFLLRNVHSIHHGYKAVYSWAGGILHPMEDICVVVCNIWYPWLFKCHWLTVNVFTFLWTLNLIEEHSGHDVWWAPYNLLPFNLGGGAAVHDLHHSKYTRKNFAFIFNAWDLLFRTDVPSEHSRCGKYIHVTLLFLIMLGAGIAFEEGFEQLELLTTARLQQRAKDLKAMVEPRVECPRIPMRPDEIINGISTGQLPNKLISPEMLFYKAFVWCADTSSAPPVLEYMYRIVYTWIIDLQAYLCKRSRADFGYPATVYDATARWAMPSRLCPQANHPHLWRPPRLVTVTSDTETLPTSETVNEFKEVSRNQLAPKKAGSLLEHACPKVGGRNIALPAWMESRMLAEGMSASPREKPRGKMKGNNAAVDMTAGHMLTMGISEVDERTRGKLKARPTVMGWHDHIGKTASDTFAVTAEAPRGKVHHPEVLGDHFAHQGAVAAGSRSHGMLHASATREGWHDQFTDQGTVGTGPRPTGLLHKSATQEGWHDHFQDISTVDVAPKVEGRLHHSPTIEGYHDHFENIGTAEVRDTDRVVSRLHHGATQEGWHDHFQGAVEPRIEAKVRGKLHASATQEGWHDHMLGLGVSDEPAFVEKEKRHARPSRTMQVDHFATLGTPNREDVPGHKTFGSPVQEGWADNWVNIGAAANPRPRHSPNKWHGDALQEGWEDHFVTVGTVNSVPVERGRRRAPPSAMGYDDHFIYSGEVAGDGTIAIRRQPSAPLIDGRWRVDRMDTSWTKGRRKEKRHVPVIT
ncbi:Cholesterol 25-hydroxylase-like protein [Perkinsus chesapeaki]|uniref:Cholesterol 25-hydroxylase-like protein n=1 Tax=Perkinsus chesapeaki TaxID=330153 RepID=A0A7J6MCM0_PERCH|nr:Cholesterol 25-hydroxylase-like protein [Perkinsus chesapeaki]